MNQEKRRQFFTHDRLGMFIDDIGHRKIKTKDGETRMLDILFRIEPLTPELAGEIDPELKRIIYTMGSGEPKRMIQAIGVKVDIPQQNLAIYTTPDTATARIMFDRCDISKTVIRSIKDLDAFGFKFRASFGNPTREQLEYVDANLYSQVFVSSEQTDPDLFSDYSRPAPAPRLKKRGEQPDLAELGDEPGDTEGDEAEAAVGEAMTDAETGHDEPATPRLPMNRAKEPRARAGKVRPFKARKAAAATGVKKRSHHKKR